jgi:hypothetical protein
MTQENGTNNLGTEIGKALEDAIAKAKGLVNNNPLKSNEVFSSKDKTFMANRFESKNKGNHPQNKTSKKLDQDAKGLFQSSNQKGQAKKDVKPLFSGNKGLKQDNQRPIGER